MTAVHEELNSNVILHSLYYNFVVYQAGLFLKGMQEQLHALASCHSMAIYTP